MHNQFVIKENHGQRYAVCQRGVVLLKSERDTLDLLALIGENDTNRILFYGENFSPDFYDLKSGLAGVILQKFSTYWIKAAIVVATDQISSPRFRELMAECQYNRQLRFFEDEAAAEQWLVS